MTRMNAVPATMTTVPSATSGLWLRIQSRAASRLENSRGGRFFPLLRLLLLQLLNARHVLLAALPGAVFVVPLVVLDVRVGLPRGLPAFGEALVERVIAVVARAPVPSALPTPLASSSTT